MYRVLVLENENIPSKVVDDFNVCEWNDIPQEITARGWKEKPFTVYEVINANGYKQTKEIDTYKL